MEQAAPRIRLSANAIKLIAVLCMTVDHIAWGFVPTATTRGQLMHLFGRITAPVMCFFLSEGYHHTKNKARYLLRMLVFAVISHFPFVYFEYGSFWKLGTESMLATLTLCLMSICIVNSERIPRPIQLPLIGLLCIAADSCDWGKRAILFALTFELARPYGRRMQCGAYAIAATVYVLFRLLEDPAHAGEMLFVFGVYLPIPLLLCYSGERGKGGSAVQFIFKWFFYLYYPAHLLLLGFLRNR